MKIPIAYYISSFCFFTLWTLLFVNGIRHGMLRHYRWFYAFAGISAAGGAARLIAVHVVEGGLSSWTFIHVYYGTEALQLLMALPVLWWLYRLDGRSLRAVPLLLIALPVLAVLAVSFASSGLHFYEWSTNAGRCFVAFAAFAVLVRRSATPELYLGRNARVILLTIFLPSFVAGCNLMLHFAESSWWPLAVFQHLEEPVGLFVWFTAFLGMRSFDPPRAVAPIDQEEVRSRLLQGLRIVRKSL